MSVPLRARVALGLLIALLLALPLIASNYIVSIMVLVLLPVAVIAARGHNVSRHRKTMIGIFTGGLIIAGLFTFLPGRIMHAVVFGH